MPDGELLYDGEAISEPEGVDCFSLKIERVEDLKDIIDFVSEVATKPKSNLLNDFEFKEIQLSELLENIFVFIPHFSSNLLPYKSFVKKLSFKEINKVFDNLDNLNWDFDHQKHDITTEKGGNEYSKQRDKLNSPIDVKKDIFNSLLEKSNLNYTFQYGDIGYNYNSLYKAFFGFDDVPYIESENNVSFSVVFRVNKRTSNLLFYDFIKGTIEGKKIVSNLFENESLRAVEFIKGKFSQMQYALEDRVNRATMLAKIKELLLNEENFKLRNILTRKRIKYINSYYEEQHKLIEIFQNPLPFIIVSHPPFFI